VIKYALLAAITVLPLSACDAYSQSSASVDLPVGTLPPSQAVEGATASAWLKANAEPFVKAHHGNVGIILAAVVAQNNLEMAVENVAGQDVFVSSCGNGQGLGLIYRPGDLFTWHYNDECNDPQMGDLTLLQKAVVK
jgi:hypothetical protein